MRGSQEAGVGAGWIFGCPDVWSSIGGCPDISGSSRPDVGNKAGVRLLGCHAGASSVAVGMRKRGRKIVLKKLLPGKIVPNPYDGSFDTLV